MNVLYAARVTSTHSHKEIEARRGDFIDPRTLKLPSEVASGPLNDVIEVHRFSCVETLELWNVVTYMNDPATLVYNGHRYDITETQSSDRPGVWCYIKCERFLPPSIVDCERADNRPPLCDQNPNQNQK